jgi:hypothetical protein
MEMFSSNDVRNVDYSEVFHCFPYSRQEKYGIVFTSDASQLYSGDVQF